VTVKHPRTIFTTPENKLIQLEWSELEAVYMEKDETRMKYMVTIAGEEFEVTSLDWVQACRFMGKDQ
jgi:hypothetical protein